MKKRARHRGISIVVVLLILTIVMVIAFAIGAHGIWNLNFINIQKYRQMAFYAAEAGLNESLLKYKVGDSTWSSGVGATTSPRVLDNGAKYYTQVTDNTSGVSDLTAPNGIIVPPGMVYFLGTGLWGSAIRKQVGVMVNADSGAAFSYAIASAGSLTVKNSNIYGNVKCDQDLLPAQGNIDMYPVDGNARLLCGASILNGNKWIRFHQSGTLKKYDCRARTAISGTAKVSGFEPIQASDSTTDTDPFIHDGSITPALSAGQTGEKLPNPDMTALLQGAITHSEVAGASTTYNTEITGGVHYFPNGVTLTSSITGNCTIVAGKPGTPGSITYNVNSDRIVNLIALDGGTGADWEGNGTSSSNASIKFENQCTINGLVYCHGPLTTQGQFTNNGSVITYKTGAYQLHDGAQANFTYNLDNIKDTPGFAKWFRSTGAGSGMVKIASWQKL